MAFERPEFSEEVLLKATEEFVRRIGVKMEKHGRGVYVSNHEGLGIVAEEYHELVEAVRSNDSVEVASEALDVALSGFFIFASFLQKEEEFKKAQIALSELTAETTVN